MTGRMTALAVVAVLAACGRTDARHEPAASVTHPVGESQLTTVTLSADAVQRLGIETAVVESLAAPPSRTVGGEIVVPPGLLLTVAAPDAGTVLAPSGGAIPAAGSRVKRGAALMQLASLPTDPARAERDAAVAAAQLRQMQAEADRTTGLYADRLVSARDNDRAQADLAAARATAEAAEAQLGLVRSGRSGTGLSALTVRAPSDGVIRTVYAAPGQAVAAGAPLAEVMRIDRLWVRVPLYAGEASRVVAGSPAVVHGLGSPAEGPTWPARPVAAPPSADPASASVDLFFELGDAPLRPGERVGVTLRMAGASAERALSVPLAAVVRDLNGGSWVYQRSDSVTFVRRRVEVTRVSGDRAVLALAPPAGTPVVTAGAAELFGVEFGAGH